MLCCDIAVLCCDSVVKLVLWHCCVVTVLCCDSVVLSLVLWQCCVVTLLCCVTVVLWQCCVVTVLCCYSVVLLQCCDSVVTVLWHLCCDVVLWHCCVVTLLCCRKWAMCLEKWKHHTGYIMIILCQGYFIQQTEELVSLLQCTAGDSWREDEARAPFCTQSVFQGLITKLRAVWTYLLTDWRIFVVILLFCGGRQPSLSVLHVMQADCWLRFNMASERYKNRCGICDRIRQALERACVGMQTTCRSGAGRESLCGTWRS